MENKNVTFLENALPESDEKTMLWTSTRRINKIIFWKTIDNDYRSNFFRLFFEIVLTLFFKVTS